MRVLAALAAVLLAGPAWAVSTRTATIYLPTAGCRDTTPGSFFSLPTTSPPGVECISEREGLLAFADAANEAAVTQFRLPSGWVSASGITVSYAWRTGTTTGSVVWCTELACVAGDEPVNPAWPGLTTSNCVSDSAGDVGTAEDVNLATDTGITITGCDTGELVMMRVSRDGAATTGLTDSVTQDADLLSVELTLVDSGLSIDNAATATALAANGANCAASSFPLGVDASGAVESCSTSISGNAATATALAANGANCDAGSYPLGVDASGAAESCGTAITGNAGTATALAANPADCSANQFANAIAASGALTCAAIADADVPNTITVDLAATATALAANPADCSANQFANAIAASGALTCAAIADADVPNTITVDLAATATALAANGANCSAGSFPLGVNASGAAESCTVALTPTTTATKSIYWPADSLTVDGTVTDGCNYTAAAVINGGPKVATVTCADNATGIIYGHFTTPDNWDAGTITLEANSFTADATIDVNSDVLAFDVSCMIRGDGDVLNSTWGTAVALDTTYVDATAYAERHATSTAITCNSSTPVAGDEIYWRAVIDNGTTDATMADVRILGFKMEYGIVNYSDN